MKENNLLYFKSFLQTRTKNSLARINIAFANHIIFFIGDNELTQFDTTNLESIRNNLIDGIKNYLPENRDKLIEKNVKLLREEFKNYKSIVGDLEKDATNFFEKVDCQEYTKNICNKNFLQFISNI
jgi:hypothetical protein